MPKIPEILRELGAKLGFERRKQKSHGGSLKLTNSDHKAFDVGDIGPFIFYEKLSIRAMELFTPFLSGPVPRTVPREWLEAMQPVIFSRWQLVIKCGMVGLLLGIFFPPLAKYSFFFLMVILGGLILLAVRRILKRCHRNILSCGMRYSGELIDIFPLKLSNGRFYALKVGFQAESAQYLIRRTIVSKEIIHFFDIDQLKYKTPINLFYSPAYPGKILLPIVIFYKVNHVLKQ